MSYHRVVVSQHAFRIIRAELAKTFIAETGGAVVGFAEGNILYVCDACFPGPRSKIWPWFVMIDGQYAGAFCDLQRDLSGGILEYVGDWHCHIAGPLRQAKVIAQRWRRWRHSTLPLHTLCR